MPAMFGCDESGVPVTLSIIVRNRVYKLRPYKARGYEAVVKHSFWKDSDFPTENRN